MTSRPIAKGNSPDYDPVLETQVHQKLQECKFQLWAVDEDMKYETNKVTVVKATFARTEQQGYVRYC